MPHVGNAYVHVYPEIKGFFRNLEKQIKDAEKKNGKQQRPKFKVEPEIDFTKFDREVEKKVNKSRETKLYVAPEYSDDFDDLLDNIKKETDDYLSDYHAEIKVRLNERSQKLVNQQLDNIARKKRTAVIRAQVKGDRSVRDLDDSLNRDATKKVKIESDGAGSLQDEIAELQRRAAQGGEADIDALKKRFRQLRKEIGSEAVDALADKINAEAEVEVTTTERTRRKSARKQRATVDDDSTVRVKVDSGDLARVQRQVNSLADKYIKISVDVDNPVEELAALSQLLDSVDTADKNVKVKVDFDYDSDEFDWLRAHIDGLDDKRVKVTYREIGERPDDEGDRTSTITAVAHTEIAEAALEHVSRDRTSTVTVNTVVPDEDTNNQLGKREEVSTPSVDEEKYVTVTAEADTDQAEKELDYLARDRTARIKAIVDQGGGAAGPRDERGLDDLAAGSKVELPDVQKVHVVNQPESGGDAPGDGNGTSHTAIAEAIRQGRTPSVDAILRRAELREQKRLTDQVTNIGERMADNAREADRVRRQFVRQYQMTGARSDPNLAPEAQTSDRYWDRAVDMQHRTALENIETVRQFGHLRTPAMNPMTAMSDDSRLDNARYVVRRRGAGQGLLDREGRLRRSVDGLEDYQQGLLGRLEERLSRQDDSEGRRAARERDNDATMRSLNSTIEGLGGLLDDFKVSLDGDDDSSRAHRATRRDSDAVNVNIEGASRPVEVELDAPTSTALRGVGRLGGAIAKGFSGFASGVANLGWRGLPDARSVARGTLSTGTGAIKSATQVPGEIYSGVRGAAESGLPGTGMDMLQGGGKAGKGMAGKGKGFASVATSLLSTTAQLGTAWIKLGGIGVATGAVLDGVAGSIGMLSAAMVPVVNSAKGVVALPGILGGAAAGAVTAMVAFSGLGDALSAIGDDEAFTEAVAELEPTARSFAESIRDVVPAAQELQDATQQEFFDGWAESFERMALSTMPILRAEMPRMASAIGSLGTAVMDTLASPQVASDIQRTFDAATEGFANMRPGMEDLTEFLTRTVRVGAEEILPGLGDAFSGWMESLNNWASEGKLTEWMNSAKEGISDLAGVFGDAWSGARDFFGGVIDGANAAFGEGGVWGALEDSVGKFAEWASSDEGQGQISSFFEGATESAQGLWEIISDIGSKVVTDLIPAFRDFLDENGDQIKELGEDLVKLATTGMDAFSALLDIVSPIVDGLAKVSDFITESKEEEFGKAAGEQAEGLNLARNQAFGLEGTRREQRIAQENLRRWTQDAFRTLGENADMAGTAAFQQLADQAQAASVNVQQLAGAFDGAQQSAAGTASIFEGIGDSIVSIPDEKTIVVDKQPALEMREALSALGAEVNEMEDGNFSIEFENEMDVFGAIEYLESAIQDMPEAEIRARGLDTLMADLYAIQDNSQVDVEINASGDAQAELERMGTEFDRIDGKEGSISFQFANRGELEAAIAELESIKEDNPIRFEAHGLDDILSQLQGFHHEHYEARVDVDVDAEGAQAEIDSLDGGDPVRKDVDAETGQAQGEIDSLSGGAPVQKDVEAETGAAKAEIDNLGAGAGVEVSTNADITPAENDIANLAQNATANVRVDADTSLARNKIVTVGDGATATVQVDANTATALGKLEALKAPTESTHTVSDNVSQTKANLQSLNALNTKTSHAVSDNASQVRANILSLNGQNTSSTHTITTVRQGGGTANATGGVVGKDGKPFTWSVNAYAGGGKVEPVRRRLAGIDERGLIYGPGTGESDDILGLDESGVPTARVSTGEFVTRADKVSPRTMPILEAINRGWTPPPAFVEALVSGERMEDPHRRPTEEELFRPTSIHEANWRGIGQHISDSYANEAAEMFGLNATRLRDIPLYNVLNPSVDAYNDVLDDLDEGRRAYEGEYRDRYREERDIFNEARRAERERQNPQTLPEDPEKLAKYYEREQKRNREEQAQVNAGWKAVRQARADSTRTAPKNSGTTVEQNIGTIITNDAQDAANRFRRATTVGFENLTGGLV